jgi:squalene cyclase
MSDWKRSLKADPTDWLLEPENPPVRYWTLVDIFDRPDSDVEVQEAHAAISTWPSVAELLASQERDGYWVKQDYYLPRTGRGTFWVLTVLADLGLTAGNEHIRRACDFMFAHQRENGEFCRRRRISGQGVVWEAHGEPCTHARIVRFLIQFGYAQDRRVRRAIDWLLPIQRDDGMWVCGDERRRGCLRATIDVLRVAALDPDTAAQPEIARAVASVCDLLMEPRMSRYHVGEGWGTWKALKYPYFGFSVISALDALSHLGYTAEEPRIAAAVAYLLSRQMPDGAWPLDQSWPNPPLDFGRVGEPNKWLTLDILRAIKRMGEAMNG